VWRCSQSYSRTAPRQLTVTEAAKSLRLSDKTVRRMIARGDIASHRIGRSLRLYERDLRAFISERRQ
jgi:excisionase family DNA binding protein